VLFDLRRYFEPAWTRAIGNVLKSAQQIVTATNLTQAAALKTTAYD
jgi:hypothetical protein